LWRETHLVHEGPDVVYRIVGGRVELVNVERLPGIERKAALTPVARFAIGDLAAVDGFGEDAGAGGFAHAAGTAKQVSLRQLAARDGVFQRGGDVALAH